MQNQARRDKIRRNDPCPCGSGRKYKKCCLGQVDWNQAIRSGEDVRKYLSIKGRNTYFVNTIAEALQLDTIEKIRNLKEYKAAFTAEAVRKIHETVMEVWPPDMDIVTALERTSSDVSGLYVGDYEREYFLRGIVRHSIYANKILVIDPFIYPTSVKDEYNPIIEPEQYRSQTLKNVNFWFALLPWIHEGIVEIIRTPADFDHKLNWDSMLRQKKKFEENEELKKAAENSVEELQKRHMEKHAYQLLLLKAPDDYIRRIFEELELEEGGYTVDLFLEHIHAMRERDPDFLEPLGPDSTSGELHVSTTGANYEIAKLTASITRSYLVTDLFVKWREIELDRESQSAENRVWVPFAKAIQNTSFKYLNSLRLEHALKLRKEGRLESLRSFLRRVWKDVCLEESFDEINAQLLADELLMKVREAEVEWKEIDTDLLKMVGAEAVAGLLAAGPLIKSGHAIFLAAAVAVAGLTNLVWSTSQRRGFPDRFPAAFFMNLEEDN